MRELEQKYERYRAEVCEMQSRSMRDAEQAGMHHDGCGIDDQDESVE